MDKKEKIIITFYTTSDALQMEEVCMQKQVCGRIIPVPKKISKTKMVHTKGAILIDDYSGNLMEWEDEGGIGIRFSSTLDSKGFKVIDRLDKILDIEI